MANIEPSSGKTPVVENPVFKLIMQAIVPVLLGALLAKASAINDAQQEQAKSIYQLQGQIGVMSQQYSDIGGRMAKVENGLNDVSQDVAAVKGRVLVLESYRRK